MSKVPPFTLRIVITTGLALAAATALRAESMTQENGHFVFRDSQGKQQSLPVVSNYYPKKLKLPAPAATAKVQRGINPSLMRAATAAMSAASTFPASRCRTR